MDPAREGVASQDREPRIVRIADPDDPRLGEFTRLRDVRLRTRREPAEGLFVAEGARTIRRAVEARYPVRAILLTERWLAGLADLIDRTGATVLLVEDEILERTTGFPVHRGALATMSRRPLVAPLVALAAASRIAVLEDLTDHTNLGAVFRSAAAFGLDAVALTPRCADPLYRRAIRTSMGAVFSVPWTRIAWREGPAMLHDLGFALIALTPAEDATPLDEVDPSTLPRAAIALGTEGEGLSSAWLDAADLRVRIPIRRGVDSLNVAAAAAVAFYHFRGRP
jgi:tRNA G18 (ribose-2'-O)-methylase SpoU